MEMKVSFKICPSEVCAKPGGVASACPYPVDHVVQRADHGGVEVPWLVLVLAHILLVAVGDLWTRVQSLVKS